MYTLLNLSKVKHCKIVQWHRHFSLPFLFGSFLRSFCSNIQPSQWPWEGGGENWPAGPCLKPTTDWGLLQGLCVGGLAESLLLLLVPAHIHSHRYILVLSSQAKEVKAIQITSGGKVEQKCLWLAKHIPIHEAKPQIKIWMWKSVS